MWQLPRSRVARVARGLSCVVVVAVHACDRHPTEPSPAAGFAVNDRLARSSHDGPPPSHSFGPDTYRVGLFTGAGTLPRDTPFDPGDVVIAPSLGALATSSVSAQFNDEKV